MWGMKDGNALSVLTCREKATLNGPLEGTHSSASLREEVTRAALLCLLALTTEQSRGFPCRLCAGKEDRMVSKSSILKLPWERYKGKTSLNHKRGSKQQKQVFFAR